MPIQKFTPKAYQIYPQFPDTSIPNQFYPIETTSINSLDQSTQIEPTPIVESTSYSETMKAKGKEDIVQPLKVYSRKKIPVSRSAQVQPPIRTVVSKIPSTRTETFTPSIDHVETIAEHEEQSDIELPIALR